MKETADLAVFHQGFFTGRKELDLGFPEIGAGAVVATIGQFEHPAAGPGIVAETGNLCVRTAAADGDPGLEETDPLESPASVGTFGGRQGTKGTAEFQRGYPIA